MSSARRVRQVSWARLRVTVVCLTGLAILATLVYLLAGGELLKPQATLYLHVSDGTGLSPGAPVRLDGISIGKVSGVKLSGSQQPGREIQVSIAVEKAHLASIEDDSLAEVSTDNLVGDKYVAITSGRGRPIRNGGELHVQPAQDMMKSLDLRQFADQLRQVDLVITDLEEGRGVLGEFVQSEDTYRGLMRSLDKMERGVRAAASTTSAAGGLLYSDSLYRSIEDPLNQLDRSLELIQSGQGSAGQLVRDSAEYDSLVKQFQALRRSAADLRAGPWLQSDALYVDLNRNLLTWIQQVDELNANPLFASSEMFDNLNGMARNLNATMRDFRLHPQKYLRIKIF